MQITTWLITTQTLFYVIRTPRFSTSMPVVLKVTSPEGSNSIARESEMQIPRLHPRPTKLDTLGVNAQPSVAQQVLQVILVYAKVWGPLLHAPLPHVKNKKQKKLLGSSIRKWPHVKKKKKISWLRYQNMTAELAGFLIILWLWNLPGSLEERTSC